MNFLIDKSKINRKYTCVDCGTKKTSQPRMFIPHTVCTYDAFCDKCFLIRQRRYKLKQLEKCQTDYQTH